MKLPVAHTLSNREASLDKDALIRNGLAEVEGDPSAGGIIRARKRPAIDSAYTTTSGQGQLLFTWTTPGELGPQETLVAVSDDTLAYGSSITTLTKALRFVQNPTSPQNISTSFTPSVTVEAVSKAGNRVTSFTSNVTVAFSDNPTGATLGGTLTHAAVSGLATFNNLTSDRSGEGFELSANASAVSGDISQPFDIPTHLVFTTQPGFAQVDDPIVCAVTAQDTAGNTDTNFTGAVTVSLFSNPTSAVLSGTTTVNAVAGVASFSDLSINIAGTYSLKAEASEVSTAYKPAISVSNSFNVGFYSVTAASGSNTGVSVIGYSLGLATGSISPSTFKGQGIVNFADTTFSSPFPPSSGFVFEIVGVVSQDFLTSITVGSATLLSSGASFSIAGGVNSVWSWVGQFMFSGAGSYTANIV